MPKSDAEILETFKMAYRISDRTDLNFKFLNSLEGQDAAAFIKELLWALGDFFDDCRAEDLTGLIRSWQSRGYQSAPTWIYEDPIYSALKQPVKQSRVALMSSTGHFITGQDPEPFGEKNMSQQDAIDRIGDFLKVAPELTEIPTDTAADQLSVRHGGYDVRGSAADRNTTFPIDRLTELANEGQIGAFHERAYSFVGAASQLRIKKDVGPSWSRKLKEAGVQAVLMVPV